MTSQNGWPLAPKTRKWIIPDTGRHLVLRDGSAGFLLAHMALWWHEELERLDLGQWDEWGYAPRPIRGSSTPSNHASATAADLNATKHPLGVAVLDTFTAAQARRIRRRLRLYAGTLRWGGDYSRRPDAMHVELDRPLRDAERVARRLMLTPRGRRILAANPGAKEVINS